MALVAIAWPSSEPESVAMVSLLQANDIPCFVHGAGLASVLPGVLIPSYNAPTLMVPLSAAAEANELLSVFLTPASGSTVRHDISVSAKVRMVFEVLLFGRFVSQPAAGEESRDDP